MSKNLQIAFLLLCVYVCTGCVSASKQSVNTLNPILIITGFSGSRLNVQDSTDTECNTNGETFRIWINKTHTASECFIHQIRLNYSDGQYSDAPGVSVTTGLFGSIDSFVNFSDIVPASDDPDLIEYFVQRGYTADISIRAAPYDWRLDAEQLNERGYYTNLKQLVEQMYTDNGNTKVTLVVISMGGPVSLYFLTQVVNQEWKDTFIHSYVTLAAAWSGVNTIISALITPQPASMFLFYETPASTQELRSLFRTFPSYYFLMNPGTVLNDTVVVSTPTTNYTANDYQQLFTDIGYPQGYTQFIESRIDWPAPNVPTYCFYGLGVPTLEKLVYDDGFPDAQPISLINGDGDGTVNKASLEICLRWANSGYLFNNTVFPGVNHAEIVSSKAVLESIAAIVGAPIDTINNHGITHIATVQLLGAVILLSQFLGF